MLIKNKYSQAWGIDLITAVAIFLVAIIVFFIYSINQTSEAKETLEDLIYNGRIITNTLLSEGYPKNWNYSNVVKIGLLTDNKLNDTKLNEFYNITNGYYNKTKQLFNTKYDYYFFLKENMTLYNGSVVDGIGKPGINRNNINATNLIKITRFTIYKEKPTIAYLYIWEE